MTSQLDKRLAGLSASKRALLEKRLQQATKSTMKITRRVERDGAVPLSFSQRRLWFLDQLHPGNPMYNLFAAFRCSGSLSLDVLESSIRDILLRHEMLRTRFVEREGQPVQIIEEEVDFEIPVHDLSELTFSEREQQMQQEAFAEAARPFDLHQGPLLRVRVLKMAHEEYVILFTMHHIASDGWSTGVMLQELTALYTAHLHGQPATLSELPIQYGDYSVWQQAQQQDGLEAQLNYWKKELSGPLPVLQLPSDHPRPSVQTYNGDVVTFQLSSRVTEELKRLAKSEDVTMFMVLLAAYQTLLSRYTGQEDLLIGTPVANRSQKETEGLIGFFVNTLVLRTEVSQTLTYRDLLRFTREKTLEAFSNQDVPFEQLVEVVQAERDMSYSPLFQTMFVLQNMPASKLEMSGVSLEPLPIHTGTAKFDLTLSVEETGAGLSGQLEFNTDLYLRATAERMSRHYVRLLEEIVASPDELLAELPLLDETEHQQVLVEWNNTAVPYPTDVVLHELFEAQVARTPERVAVQYEGQTLTYSQLNERADQMAAHLRALGVRPDLLVGVCMERSLEMVVALYGILKAGGAYVPLDPTLPEDRLAFMIEDARASIILTQSQFLPYLKGETAHVLPLDTEWSRVLETSADASVSEQVRPDHLAYVIYTSGSTGRPKGVMNTHQGIVNRLLWMQDEYQLDETDRVLQKTPYSFDVSVWEFFWPLLFGARLIIARPEGHKDPRYLVDLLVNEQITTMHFVPSMLHFFLDESSVSACDSLRRVFCSGEALTQTVQDRFFERFPNVELHNLYGPTEAAIDVTFWACQPNTGKQVPIGRPIANMQVYLLDAVNQPVPIGVPGELHIGGIGLARGYWNRPELTEEKFIRNPFQSEPASRLYKTGDLARYLADGTIEYLGRIDSQVKLRGFRIELGEIEAVLAEHAEIREVAVVAYEEQPGQAMLVAYVTGIGETVLENESLRQHLQGKLPDYMLPSHFMQLRQLPYAPNGKLNRKALPKPILQEVSAYVEPRTQIEKQLADIWADILGLERVGIYDNFFRIGGHSLLATRVLSHVCSMWRVDLPVRALFEEPTVAALSGRIEKLAAHEYEDRRPPLLPVERGSALPLSYAQKRLWFLLTLVPDSTFYNIPLALRLTGPLEKSAFAATLQELVKRHESLRTTFAVQDGSPIQIVREHMKVPLEHVDLRNLQGAVLEKELRTRAEAEACATFDLASGPLVRTVLLASGEEEHCFLFTLHHIIADAWSIEVLLRDMQAIYKEFCKQQLSPLPPLNIQYADYAVWQRNWLQGDVLNQQIAYWKQQLGGPLPVLELPSDRQRPPIQTYRGAKYAFALPTQLVDRLKEVSQQADVTLFMTCLAAFQTLLYRYTGQTDLLIGTPIANRTHRDLEDLVGFFVNTLVLRTDLSGQRSFRDLLERVRSVTLDAYANQDLPFEQLVDLLQPPRDLSHTPLFQIFFMFQNVATGKRTFAENLDMQPLLIDNGTAKYDLTLSLEETEGRLEGVFEYNSDLFNCTTIERMTGHYQTLLNAVCQSMDTDLLYMQMMQASEWQTFDEWNRTEATYSSELCIQDLFEHQVECTPDAPALVFAGQTLTYLELNEKANKTARYLRKLGVGPDVRVGICLERSINMAVGLLAVLKAGGAYLPLDPAYPSTRLAYMMEDSKATILLTQTQLLDQLPIQDRQVVCMDTQWSEIEQEAGDNLVRLSRPDHLVYVIYTSGSTGNPKGVAMPHKVLTNLIEWQVRESALPTGARTVQFTTLSFDVALQEIFSTWCAGGELVMLTEAMRRDFKELALFMGAERIERVFLPFVALQNLAEVMESNSITPGHLKQVITAGEALQTTSALRSLFRRIPNCQLINQYGPSENHIMTAYTLTGSPDDWHPLPPIGKPISNCKVYVLDENRRRVPIGVLGELYIGGLPVANGYLNKPELTAERFIEDPFAGQNGSRMYKTGDLVRLLLDGNIEFLGRADHQVKVRGFRIELGEIEAVMATHPQIQQAVVTIQTDETRQKRLVGYYSLVEDATLTWNDLRSFLMERLPDYMVPVAYVTMERFPVTPSGKVDRRSLPAPSKLRPELTSTYVEPSTIIERRVTEVWKRVLKLETVGAEDNFFDLGGNSLLLMQLQTALQIEFQQEIPVLELFKYPTVSAFSASVLNQDSVSEQVANQEESKQEELTRVNREAGKNRMKERLAKRNRITEE